MAFIILLVVATFATWVTASPIEKLAQSGQFSVQQVPGRPKPAVPVLMRETFAKFGAALPKEMEAAAADTDADADTGSAVATPESNDLEYLVEATVGDTKMRLNLDTGSADLWVYTSALSTTETQGHEVYNSTASGKQISGANWKVSYGDGSEASGNVYADKVVIGGVTATSQAVEAATSVSSSFGRDSQMDGLVGLALSKINTVKPTKQTTFFDTIKAQLKSPLFAVILKKGQPGSFDFGYIDQTKYTGNITYIDADDSRGYWGLSLEGFKIGNGTASTETVSAIVDSGTTLLYLPIDIVNSYYNSVTGASSNSGSYTFPCTAKLPDFGLVIGGKVQTVPGSYLNHAPLSRGSATCEGALVSNFGLGLSVLGDVFLKSQYVVHDMTTSKPRLGFAPQAGL